MVLPGYDNPAPGQPVRCGRYELLERIGYGGMAEVFKARLPGPAGFEKIVVIKRILPRLLDDSMVVRMFVEEARIAAAADHDNIAQVFELGQAEDGKYFMVMEYIRGVDLEVLLAGAAKRALRVPAWFGVHAVAEVLEALSFVHGLLDESGRSRNVIHRDATPSNIFISYKGQVKLSDFGVADFEGKSPTTRAGQLKGKLSYMSPEQLNGQMLDQRSDIFTMGVVLWEILTQQRLFGGLNEMQAMIAICEGERRPPSSMVPGISPALDRVSLKALAAFRDDRYTTAAEFQGELLDALHEMHRPVRHVDVQEVLQVLLGRNEPTGDLLASGIMEGVSRESSFLLPIESPQLDSVDETLLPLGGPRSAAILNDTADVEENQDPTVSVAPEELRALMATHSPTADLAREAARSAQTLRFWLRSSAGLKSEALDWIEVTRRLDGGGFASGFISADETHWIGVPELARLVGDDRFVEPDSAASNITTMGTLKDRSLISLLSVHARDRSSGTLSFVRTDSDSLEWYELHLYNGRPTRIVSNLPGAQLPALLSNRAGVPEPLLWSLIHAAVGERRSLLDVASGRGISALDGESYAAARLAGLFAWQGADFSYTVAPIPRHTTPLASSILRLLPAVVSQTLPPARLRELLGRRIDLAYEPSWRFDDGLQELQLDEQGRAIAARLVAQESLRTLLTQLPEERVLTIGYVLLEADLLVEAFG